MTLDLKDLEAGDTVELRCGGRAVVSSVEPDITKYIVGLEEDTWAYNQNGSWFDCFRSTHPFDIVAIHKKPKPRHRRSNDGGGEVTPEARKILAMIEAGDRRAPDYERQINKAVALYLGWVRIPPSEMRNKKGGWAHPSDCQNGRVIYDQMHGTEIHRDIPSFCTSRDALKAIRPGGYIWTIECRRNGGSRCQAWSNIANHPTFYGRKNVSANEPLQTEELAELHAIIQAIDYERSNNAA